MHLRSGKKTIFTPSPLPKRTPGRWRGSPLAVKEAAAKTITAAATRWAPSETITPPYTPTTTTKPYLGVKDWRDLEVAYYRESAVDAWDSGGVPEHGTGAGQHVCAVEGVERKGGPAPRVSAFVFWGLVAVAFVMLYPGEGGAVGARVGGVYKGVYEGIYLWEWAFILSQFIWNRGEVLVDL